jgi:hypothetical protein
MSEKIHRTFRCSTVQVNTSAWGATVIIKNRPDRLPGPSYLYGGQKPVDSIEFTVAQGQLPEIMDLLVDIMLAAAKAKGGSNGTS